MLFSQLRHTIAKHARVVLFYYVALLLLLVLTTTGRTIVNAIGQHYIDVKDTIVYSWVAKEQWQAFDELGNISRHHRYAPLKTQAWQNSLTKQQKLDKSHTRWINKNKRNIAMQLQLAEYYAAQGKHGKSFKILQKLYSRVPDHPQLAKAFQQAAKKMGLGKMQTPVEPSVLAYFKP